MAEAIRWSPEAAQDLQEIHDFISNPRTLPLTPLTPAAIYDGIGRLALFPRSAPEVPELPGRRQLVVGNYLIIYRVDPGAVIILAIVHAARSVPDIMKLRG